MKLFMRGTFAALAITGAALIAVGCGGSGGSGASAAAKDSAMLDLVPKDAIGYATVDLDFAGDNWGQFDDLAKAFDKDFKGVNKTISDEAASGEEGDEVDWEKDVDPWLGKSGGAALLRVTEKGESADFFIWVELDDSKKFETFVKGQDGDFKAGKDIGDYKTFESADEDESYIAYNDEYAIMGESRSQVEGYVEFDGDSIADAEGVSDAIDETEGDALATFVLNGDGLRDAIKASPELKSLGNAKQLKDFHAAAISFSAEDDGMRIDGHVRADGEAAGENAGRDLFESLPANTVLAFGAHDFGGGLKTTAEEAGKDNAQVQQVIGVASGALGVDLDDIAKAFDGEFVLGIAAEDEGLGALAGGVAGAAMGGGLSGVDPAQLMQAGSVILAFEETGDSGETLDKIVGAAGGLAGAGGAPKTGTSGDFETKELAIQGLPITTAASDDVAALTLGLDVFEGWGKDTLGESDSFTAAWDAAKAPDESLATMWFDAGRVAELAGVEGDKDVELGGMVGWIEADDSNANFGAFVHVDEG